MVGNKVRTLAAAGAALGGRQGCGSRSDLLWGAELPEGVLLCVGPHRDGSKAVLRPPLPCCSQPMISSEAPVQALSCPGWASYKCSFGFWTPHWAGQNSLARHCTETHAIPASFSSLPLSQGQKSPWSGGCLLHFSLPRPSPSKSLACLVPSWCLFSEAHTDTDTVIEDRPRFFIERNIVSKS